MFRAVFNFFRAFLNGFRSGFLALSAPPEEGNTSPEEPKDSRSESEKILETEYTTVRGSAVVMEEGESLDEFFRRLEGDPEEPELKADPKVIRETLLASYKRLQNEMEEAGYVVIMDEGFVTDPNRFVLDRTHLTAQRLKLWSLSAPYHREQLRRLAWHTQFLAKSWVLVRKEQAKQKQLLDSTWQALGELG